MAAITPSAPSPLDGQIQAALLDLDKEDVDFDGLGWSDLEKELLRKLKGKEREVDSLVVSSSLSRPNGLSSLGNHSRSD